MFVKQNTDNNIFIRYLTKFNVNKIICKTMAMCLNNIEHSLYNKLNNLIFL